MVTRLGLDPNPAKTLREAFLRAVGRPNDAKKPANEIPLAPDAVDRIIAAVGDKHVPPNINRDELALLLGICRMNYLSDNKKRTAVERRARERDAKLLAARAAALLEMLDDDRCGFLRNWLPAYPGDALLRSYPPGTPSLQDMKRGLAMLGGVASEMPNYEVPEATALKRLVILQLPQVYTACFGKDHGRSPITNKGNTKVDGPYVRFAQAVAAEFGISLAADTIDTYLKPSHRALG